MEKMHVKMTVNGKDVDLLTEPRTLLIHALRAVSYTHLTLPTKA